MVVEMGSLPLEKTFGDTNFWQVLQMKVKRENYAVRQSVMDEALKKLGVTPTIDAFADKANNRLAKWWGEGSPWGGDAFEQSWEGELLWANPPYTMLEEVVARIKKENAHVVLVMPEWTYRDWHKEAMDLVVDSVFFRRGTSIFELKGRPTPFVKWPVRIALLCGHKKKCTNFQVGQEGGGLIGAEPADDSAPKPRQSQTPSPTPKQADPPTFPTTGPAAVCTNFQVGQEGGGVKLGPNQPMTRRRRPVETGPRRQSREQPDCRPLRPPSQSQHASLGQPSFL